MRTIRIVRGLEGRRLAADAHLSELDEKRVADLLHFVLRHRMACESFFGKQKHFVVDRIATNPQRFIEDEIGIILAVADKFQHVIILR